MYFDEAHCLHDVHMTHFSTVGTRLVAEQRTAFHALTSALDQLFELNIFSLFLSTSSSLADFAPPRKGFGSARSSGQNWDLQPPFTELPFDLCDKGTTLVVEGEHTLQDICQIKFMAKFGRPL
jgi:hypothetical protein